MSLYKILDTLRPCGGWFIYKPLADLLAVASEEDVERLRGAGLIVDDATRNGRFRMTQCGLMALEIADRMRLCSK